MREDDGPPQQAAEQGDVTSQFTLGVMYANGTGVAQSDEQAVEWYRKAANQGLTRAWTGTRTTRTPAIVSSRGSFGS